MIQKTVLLLIVLFSATSLKAQENKKGILAVKKIGLLFNSGNENNILFNDKDYYFQTKVLKIQAFYTLGKWKNIDFELIVQPQIQSIKHQLINEQFVLPTEEHYLEKRTEFTRLKNLNLYAVELGFVLRKKILKKVHIQATIGLGIASINKRTERLAKGFTFIENAALGISYQTSNTTFLYIGSSIGHISNLNFKSPNSGYNILGYEIGLSFIL
jgi:hypothetical protein